MKKLILASNSPRRKELLQQVQIEFEPDPSQLEEVLDFQLSPDEMVLRLAEAKAQDVASRHKTGRILAADTMVIFKEHRLGKPQNRQDAASMLRLLSGQKHQVMTAVVLMDLDTHRRKEAVETTTVTMGHISEGDLEWYLNSGESFGKAGAYAIQGLAARFIQSVEGCYYNVIGLPLFRVIQMMKELDE